MTLQGAGRKQPGSQSRNGSRLQGGEGGDERAGPPGGRGGLGNVLPCLGSCERRCLFYIHVASAAKLLGLEPAPALLVLVPALVTSTGNTGTTGTSTGTTWNTGTRAATGNTGTAGDYRY